MRLYSLHKRQLVGILILFYVGLFLTFFIGIIGPNVFQSIDYTSANRSKQLVTLIEFLFSSNSMSLFYFH